MFPDGDLLLDATSALNDEQRAAVAHDGDRLRILAGAGTGKTTTLTARVAWLVAHGTPAERILLVTFTRRAARQMVARTDSMLRRAGVQGGTRVRGGTFHSLAHRTLRRHAVALGLPEGFSVLDPADAADVVDLVRTDALGDRATARRFPRKATLLDVYSRAVNTQRPLSEVLEQTAPWALDRVDDVAEVCRGYVARKRALGLLDFDDLLLHWRAAVRHPALGATLADEVDHVCVDEYQDVNALQVDVLAALCGTDRSEPVGLTIVGDDSQAVYAFRGSSPRHLLDADDAFPGLHTVTLEQNYRSSQPLLDVANALAAAAPEGFSTRLRSEQLEGERPELVRCADEDRQVAAVCDRVLGHREAGIRLQDQAVLVRAAHHSAALELELGRRRIPYVKYGGLRFLEAAHVKDLVAAFRVADNPRDELSWFRLLQLLEGVGPARARRVVSALGVADGVAENEVLTRWPVASSCLPSGARPMADSLVAALAAREGEATVTRADRLLVALTPVLERHYDDAAQRLADLGSLVAAAEGATRLADVAAELTLDAPSSSGDLAGPPVIDDDWLVISTVHSAKGLEWDVVHLLHATDGNFPSDMALGDREGLEEERRLFYVALTRPARALHVYHPLRYHLRPRGRDDAHTYGQPSRFLDDRVQSLMTRSSEGTTEPVVTLTDSIGTVELELDALWR